MPEIDWNVDNTRILCRLLAEQVEKGHWPNTFLNSIRYAAVEKGFKDRTGIDLTKNQIKNKWDKLKEDFKAWIKLTTRQTGIGWNNDTIDMDDEWWKKARSVSVCTYEYDLFFTLIAVVISPNMCCSLVYFQDILGCGKFRKHPLQNKDELAICFQASLILVLITATLVTRRYMRLPLPPVVERDRQFLSRVQERRSIQPMQYSFKNNH
jgi:hypothetical protein